MSHFIRRFRNFQNKPRLNTVFDEQGYWGRGIFDCFLFNENAGGRYNNLVNPQGFGDASGTTPPWDQGLVYPFITTSNGSRALIVHHGGYVGGDFTIRVIFRCASLANTYNCLFAKQNSQRELGLFFDTSGNVSYYDIGNTSNGFSSVGTNLTVGPIYDLVWSRIASDLTLYINGVAKVGTGNWTGTVTGTATSTNHMFLGYDQFSSGSNYGNFNYFLWQAWVGRGLTGDEVQELYNFPFEGFRFKRRFTGAMVHTASSPASPATLFRRGSTIRTGSRA